MDDPSNKCLMPVKSETVTCPHCKLVFNDNQHKPYLLTCCGHTICFTCCTTLRNQGVIKCPICTKIVVGQRAQSLPVNYELMNIALAFPNHHINQENQEEVLNDLWDTKEKTIGPLNNFCKNMAQARDQLLDASIEALLRSVWLLSHYVEASKLYQNATMTMNQVLELSGNEYTKGLKEKLDCINSVLEHMDDYQVDINTVNTKRLPSIKLKLNNGSFGELKMEEEGLHLYCFTEFQTSGDLVIKVANVEALHFSQVCTTVFLDVAQGESDIGRIYIDICESRGYAKLFVSMCLGSHGISFKGTKFGSSFGLDPNFLFAGVYEDEEGKESTDAPFEGVNLKDIPCGACTPGSIIARINLDGNICTKFLVFLKEVTLPMPTVGSITKGMDIVHQIKEHLLSERCVMIKNCGIVMKKVKENPKRVL
ncbi:uncharacterized protein LOC143018051 isoform X2 [Oratosquilla oratoria]